MPRWLLYCLFSGWVSVLWADDSQPLYIAVNEQSPGFYQLAWRIPATFKADNIPTVVLPDFCQPVMAGHSPRVGVGRMQQLYRCDQALPGHGPEWGFPRYKPSTSTLVKYQALSGEQHTRLLSPGETRWIIPLAETPSRIAKDYTLLGMQHIWAGTDHLLFVLCLLWIAGSWRRVLITITGFTVAHSITLVLSALQWVSLPVPPVEAVIALSIVYLATEIVKDKKETLTWRYPIAVSSAFGLLHGFGFAAALAEIGLPQTELLTGLVFFNLGVEIGQIVFAGAALLLMAGFKQYLFPLLTQYRWALHSRYLSAYAIGTLASYWLIERSLGFVV